MSAKQHYDTLLGEVYSWMAGDLREKQAAFASFLSEHHITPIASTVALDLGAAHGIQSMALAEKGFSVTAIDFNNCLLEELKRNSEGLAIAPANGDIRLVKQYASSAPELIICWGDTITHLDSKAEIAQLVKDCYEILSPQGRLLLSFRDNTADAAGTQRIIPVKSDSTKTMTCTLDYGTDKVKVTDGVLYHTDGGDKQVVSSYDKVRLSQHDMEDMLTEAGFTVTFNAVVSGFNSFVAVKNY